MRTDFVRGMSDAKRWFRHSGLCVRNRMGQNVASSSPASPDRRSPDQLAFRQAVKEAGLAWGALDGGNRQAWDAYARRHAHLLSDQLYKDLSGWEVFLPAFLSRSLLGAAPPSLPAALPPPGAVIAIEEVPATEDDTFSFRVTHGVAPEGHTLVVRITPATATRARRPYARTARMIRGHGPDSVVPLPASGGVVTFPQARFSVAPGQRFGVTMRIMRLEDGVVSREYFADLLRAEPPADLVTSPEAPLVEKKAAAILMSTPTSMAAEKPHHAHNVHPVHDVQNVDNRQTGLGGAEAAASRNDSPAIGPSPESSRVSRASAPAGAARGRRRLGPDMDPVRQISPNQLASEPVPCGPRSSGAHAGQLRGDPLRKGDADVTSGCCVEMVHTGTHS